MNAQHTSKRWPLWLLRLGLTGLGLLALGVWFRFLAPGWTRESGYLEIRRNRVSVAQVGTLMERADLVSSAQPLKELAKLRGVKSYKPGRYFIEKRMSTRAVHQLLASGRQTPLNLVLKPCSGPEALAAQLGDQLEVGRLEWMQWFKSEEHLLQCGLDRHNWTSLVLPNTYEVYWTLKPEAFTKRMLSESEAFWKGRRDALADAVGLSRTEVVALASIVEWETKQIDEMPRVAGLYLNRLRDGWKLESDPTVIRAIALTQGRTDVHRVYSKDLQINHPYNTYRYPGLPPGPISIPSIQAIDAVLNAERHDYFFMVASTERQGYHEYAKADEYEKHLEYARQYRRFLDRIKVR